MSTRRSTRRIRQRINDSDTGATEESAAETDTELAASQLGPVVEAVATARGALEPHSETDEQPRRRSPATAERAAADEDRPVAEETETISQLQQLMRAHRFEDAPNAPPPESGQPQDNQGNDDQSDGEENDDDIHVVENGQRRLMTRSEWYDTLISDEEEREEPAAPPPSRYMDCRELLALSPTMLRGRLDEVAAAIPLANPEDAQELRNHLAIATALQEKREFKQQLAAAAAQERRRAREDATADDGAVATDRQAARRPTGIPPPAADTHMHVANRPAARMLPASEQAPRRVRMESAVRPQELALPANSRNMSRQPAIPEEPLTQRRQPTAETAAAGERTSVSVAAVNRRPPVTVRAPPRQPEYMDLYIYLTYTQQELLLKEDEIRRAVPHAHPDQAATILRRLEYAHYCNPLAPVPAVPEDPIATAENSGRERNLDSRQPTMAAAPATQRESRRQQPLRRAVSRVQSVRRSEIAGHPVPRNTPLLSPRPYCAVRNYPDEVLYNTDSEPTEERARRQRQAAGPHRVRSLAERLAVRSRSPLIPEPGSRVGRSRMRDRLRPKYNPMRVHSPWNKTAGQTRRQARRALYDMEYGEPEGGDYPSSDTDWSEEYTTEQEGFAEVEARYAGNTDENDWRLWPWPKMRKALKELKRHYRAEERNPDPRTIATSLDRLPTGLPAATREYVRRLQDELVRYKQKASQSARGRSQSRERSDRKKQAAGSRSRSAVNRDPSPDSEGDRCEVRPSDSHARRSKRVEAVDIKQVRRQAARSVSGSQRKPRSRLTTSRKSTSGRAFDTDTSSDDSDNSEAPTIRPLAPVAPVVSRSVASGFMGDTHKTSLEIPIFTGENWPTFRNQFERVAEHLGWTPEEKAVYLHNAIRGEAATALSSAESKNWSYEELVEHMEMRHGKNKTYGDVFLELMNAHRRPGQSLASWNDQVISIVNTGQLSEEQTQAAAFDGFLYGLRSNTSLYNKVAAARVQTIEEAFKIAKKWERNHGSRSYMSAGVNMIAAGEPDRAVGDSARAPEVLKLAIQKSSGPLTMQALSDFAQQLGGRIEGVGETLSERFDKRFDDLSGRVTTLETRVNQGYQDTRPQRSYYNNNNSSGGYGRGYSGNNGGGRRGNYNSQYRSGPGRNYNDGYQRDDRDRRNDRSNDDDPPRRARDGRGNQRSRSPDRRNDARQQAGQFRSELRQQGQDRSDDRQPNRRDADRSRQPDSRGGQSQRE